MILTREDFERETNRYFVAPVRSRGDTLVAPYSGDESGITFPAIVRGEHIAGLIHKPYAKISEGLEPNSIAPQSDSVDIRINLYTNTADVPQNFPVILGPGERIIGHSGLELLVPHMLVASVEMKSGFARKGITCRGFNYDGKSRQFARWVETPLSFVFENHSPFTYLIPEPAHLVQVSGTKGSTSYKSTGLRLARGERDVTDENKTDLGLFTAYATHLSPKLVYYRKTDERINLLGNDHEQFAVRTTIGEMPDYLDFCLTLTEEKIDTNGSPAYMLPFHYLDVMLNHWRFGDADQLSSFFEESYEDTGLMPVTANAGLIHAGSKTHVVHENIARGRDLKKYFRVGEPFALVIPLPFSDGKTDTSYDSPRGRQTDIIF